MRNIFIFLIIIITFLLSVMSVALNDTGYYLPKGYKVDAVINVPPAPFWFGVVEGDSVGVKDVNKVVYVVGVGYKLPYYGIYSGHAIHVVVQEGNERNVVYEITNEDGLTVGKHKVTIYHSHEGTVYVSIDNVFAYSFRSVSEKLSVVAKGAIVYPPEYVDVNDDKQVGQGYNPTSVNEYIAYMVLGAGVLAIFLIATIVMRLRK